MKVGVLTFHNTTNYGAVYQTFALQRYINSLGVDCEVIDYNNKYLLNNYSINPFRTKEFSSFVKRIVFLLPNYKLKKKFRLFLKKYINISSKKFNNDNIKDADNLYDLFISGSDQVWNLKLNGNDKNYFMTFSDDLNKRNSYAASLGKVDFSKEEFEQLKELISVQNNISVRERQSIDFINKFNLENNILSHIDPTFLIKKEEWEFIADGFNLNKDYLFVYEVSRTPHLREFSKFLSKKFNLEIVFISGSSKNIEGALKLTGVSPERFLSLIINAKFVVTSSFHGLALSLILNKNVYFDVQSEVGNLSSRLENLSNILGVTSRKINANYEMNDFSNIDFDRVNKLIINEVDKSKDYINSIINK